MSRRRPRGGAPWRPGLAGLLVAAVVGCSAAARPVDPGIELHARNLREASDQSALRGDLERARTLARRSVDAYRTIDDLAQIAAGLNRLGNLQQELGDAPAARRAYLEAADLSRQADVPGEEAAAQNNLGTLAERTGDAVQARARYEKALHLAASAGAPAIEAAAENNLGLLEMQAGQFDGAQRRFERALALDESAGDPAGRSIRYKNLGALFRRQGEPQRALEAFEMAYTIDRSREDVRGVATSLVALSETRSDVEGGLAQALSERRRAWGIHQLLGADAQARRDEDWLRRQCERPAAAGSLDCSR